MKFQPFHKSILSIAGIAALALASVQAESATSWDDIKAKAASENKPIVLEFTGSDWCPPCMMMNKEVFSTDAFKKYADSDIVFVKLDFPRKTELPADEKARNDAMAEQFSVEAFPTIVVLDSTGKEIARNVGFMRGGPDAFISWVKDSTKG